MTRTLFIGLDGATFTVLGPLTSELPESGVTMPYLKQLMENGTRAKLRSTPNPLTPPAWVSVMTGRTPGHHGVHDFLRVGEANGEIYFTMTDSRDIRTETIWSIASRQGRSVVSLNFPIMAPPRAISGSLVPGLVPWKHLRRNVSPPQLFDRLKSVPGFDPKELAFDYEKETQVMQQFSHEETENWLHYHIAREEQWFRIAETLLSEDQPDLMAVMFDGTDKIQHQAWTFLDPELVGSDNSPWAKRMIGLCREYFRKLDEYIERLVTLAGPDAQVFFASDHGFTASTEKVRINSILHDLGYLAWHEHDDSEARRRHERSWFADVDWQRTVAYCRTPSSNGISIRVASTPDVPGVVPEEYDTFRDNLIRELENVRDEETGERIIRKIHKREDVFPGPAMKDAPDLLLVLRDFGFVAIANGRPTVERRPVPLGTHHPDGIFIAYGPGIRSGVTGERQHVHDVAAILLYSLNLPVPADFEGEVAEGVFSPRHVQERPIRIGSPTRPVRAGEVQADDMPDEEKQKIINQLKMLGYME